MDTVSVKGVDPFNDLPQRGAGILLVLSSIVALSMGATLTQRLVAGIPLLLLLGGVWLVAASIAKEWRANKITAIESRDYLHVRILDDGDFVASAYDGAFVQGRLVYDDENDNYYLRIDIPNSD